MMDRRQILLGLPAGLLACRAQAQDRLAQEMITRNVAPDAPGTVADIASGDTLILQDTRSLKLAGVEAPRSAQGAQAAQPFFAQSRDFLDHLTRGKAVTLQNVSTDRYGRVHAHVFAGDVWIQGEMLRAGLVRVRTWPDEQARAAEMLKLETMARNNKTGLWNDPFYAVRSPKSVVASVGSFQIVAGEVVDAAVTRTMTYLNFGADWRTDFTAQADKKTARAFRKSGMDLAGLSGARVQVRGLIKSYHGPQIWMSHPAQLQLLA